MDINNIDEFIQELYENEDLIDQLSISQIDILIEYLKKDISKKESLLEEK